MKNRDIPALTGLRGVAALLVVFTHFWFWTRTVSISTLPLAGSYWLQLSDIGMSIFFTLSGYVIALSYGHWDWRSRPAFNLVRLFFYRFARLYPAFMLFVLLVILRNPPLRDFSDPAAQAYLWPHLALWQSWWPVKFDGAIAIDDRFNVSWSLSTECGLYLLFGLGAILAAALPSWRYKRAALAIIFFVAVSAVLVVGWRERSAFLPPGWTDREWNIWLFHISPLGVALQFGVGVAVYSLSKVRLPERLLQLASDGGAFVLVALYLSIATRVVTDLFDIALIASCATGAVMLGAATDTTTNRLLSSRLMLYVGTISYSLYLFHLFFPHIGFNGELPVYDGTAKAYHALSALVSLCVTFLAAHGAYHLIEVPGRRIIRRAADRLLGIQNKASLEVEATRALAGFDGSLKRGL